MTWQRVSGACDVGALMSCCFGTNFWFEKNRQTPSRDVDVLLTRHECR
jgi:hypothetical protein